MLPRSNNSRILLREKENETVLSVDWTLTLRVLCPTLPWLCSLRAAIFSSARMPLIKSAIKRSRQNEVRRIRRQPYKTQLKTMMRKFADSIKAGKKEDTLKLIPAVHKAIDMAAKKHIIHPNNASRKKALIARQSK